jgi:hypothetical protein
MHFSKPVFRCGVRVGITRCNAFCYVTFLYRDFANLMGGKLPDEEARTKEPIEMLIKHMAIHVKDSSLLGGEKAHHISEGMSFTIGSAPPERVKLSLPNEKTDGHIQVFDKTGKVLPVEGKISLENGRIYYTNFNENGVELIDREGKVSAGVYKVGARLFVDPSQKIMLSGVYPVRVEIKEAEIELGEREQLLKPKSEREIISSIKGWNFDLNLQGVIKLIDAVSAILEREKQAGKLGIGIDKEGVSVQGMTIRENGVAHLPKEGEAIIVGKPDYLEGVLLETHFVDRVLNGEKVYLTLTGGYIHRLGNIENEETQKLFGLVLGLKKEFTNNVVILSEKPGAGVGAFQPEAPAANGIQYGEEGRKVVAERYKRLFEQMPNSVKMENGISITQEGAENIAKDISEVIKPGEKKAYAVVDLSKDSDDPTQVQIGYI